MTLSGSGCESGADFRAGNNHRSLREHPGTAANARSTSSLPTTAPTSTPWIAGRIDDKRGQGARFGAALTQPPLGVSEGAGGRGCDVGGARRVAFRRCCWGRASVDLLDRALGEDGLREVASPAPRLQVP